MPLPHSQMLTVALTEDEADPTGPTMLALCEQERLVLRPHVPYEFYVADGCGRCEELANIACGGRVRGGRG